MSSTPAGTRMEITHGEIKNGDLFSYCGTNLTAIADAVTEGKGRKATASVECLRPEGLHVRQAASEPVWVLRPHA